jgi:general L-amino acid transport system substrate-binding protein
VLFTLILAEEHGVTRANVATKLGELKQLKVKFWTLSSGGEVKLGHLLGTPEDWALHAISAVGNYGELYERTVGRDSPLKIERGLNRLWSEGGLMYAPPVD